MPDPPREQYNGKMYIHESQGYNNQPRSGSNSNSTYSTLKDSYRNYLGDKESSPPYNSSSSQSTLKADYGLNREEYEYRSSPDRKITGSPGNNSTYNSRRQGDPFSPPGNIDYIDEDIPYHARQTSQPFSYGATPDMIKHQKLLSSPSLVRKASFKEANSANNTAPIAQIDDFHDNVRRPISPLTPKTPDPPTSEYVNGSAKPVDQMDG